MAVSGITSVTSKADFSVDNLTKYFSQFGVVEKAVIIFDKQTGRKRGFGFVFFEDTDSATKVVLTKNPVLMEGGVTTPPFSACWWLLWLSWHELAVWEGSLVDWWTPR
uniref:RRM domain-containing protein n=1 Tax=Sander lucioperca TaxID=283035 RepID=A0A8D0A594_SANLU